jgi:capsular polysaccharide transport system ATP-binding protein
MSMNGTIELRKINKGYPNRHGTREVLTDVNMTILHGEHFGILGKNGAGKSTLIRLISGQEHADSGQIRRRMRVSWPLAFTTGFQGSLSGLDNVRFISRIYGVDHEKVRPFVEDFSELGKQLREPVKHYSSGMQARLAFALSLAIEFDCYLIDEITAVGDARFHQRCHHELFEKRKDRALIMVSHDMNFVKSHCERIAILEEGNLRIFEDKEEAFTHYMHHVMQIE